MLLLLYHQYTEILFHVGVVIFVECNENILDKRTADVSKLLTTLRSVSMKDDHGNSDWKVCFLLVPTSDPFFSFFL